MLRQRSCRRGSARPNRGFLFRSPQSGRNTARTTLGGTFRHAPFRYVESVPNSTIAHVSASPPPLILDGPTYFPWWEGDSAALPGSYSASGVARAWSNRWGTWTSTRIEERASGSRFSLLAVFLARSDTSWFRGASMPSLDFIQEGGWLVLTGGIGAAFGSVFLINLTRHRPDAQLPNRQAARLDHDRSLTRRGSRSHRLDLRVLRERRWFYCTPWSVTCGGCSSPSGPIWTLIR